MRASTERDGSHSPALPINNEHDTDIKHDNNVPEQLEPAKAENTPQHELWNAFTLWWRKKSDGKISGAEYENLIVPMCTVKTVEEFWQMYAYLERIDKLQKPSVISFFVAGIRPAWEDEQNANGGIFSLSVRDTMNSSKIWENLLLSLIGHQFSATIEHTLVDYTEEITGIEVKNIHDKLNITVWNRSSQPVELVNDIKSILNQILKLPDSIRFDYKANPKSRGPFPPRQNPRRNPADRDDRSRDHDGRQGRDVWQGSLGAVGGQNRRDNGGYNGGNQYRGRGRQFGGERGGLRDNHYQYTTKK